MRKHQNQQEPRFEQRSKVVTLVLVGLLATSVAVLLVALIWWQQDLFRPLLRQPNFEREAAERNAAADNMAAEAVVAEVEAAQVRHRELLALFQAANKSGDASQVRAAVAAVPQGDDERAALLKRLLSNVESTEARSIVLLIDTYALGDLPDAASLIAKQLESPIPEVRQEALYALAALEVAALPQLPEILDVVLKGDERKGLDVHLSPFHAGIQHWQQSDREVAAWVVAYLVSRCGNIMSAADATLIAKALGETLRKEKDNEVRKLAAFTLVLLGPREPQVIPALVEALGRPEFGSTSGEIIGNRYLRAALLQYGELAWDPLIEGLAEEFRPLRDDREQTVSLGSQQVLLAQGIGPLKRYLAAANEIRATEGWERNAPLVQHLKNILVTIGELGPAAQEIVPTLEAWSTEEVLKEVLAEVLPKIRPEALEKLADVAITPAPTIPPKFYENVPKGDRAFALRYHNEERVRALEAIERLGPSAAAVLPKLEQLQFGEDTSLQFAMVRTIWRINPESTVIAKLQKIHDKQLPAVSRTKLDPSRHDFFLSWLHDGQTDLKHRPRWEPRTLVDAPLEKVIGDLSSLHWETLQEALRELAERGELESQLPKLIELFPRDLNPNDGNDPLGRQIAQAFWHLGPRARPAIPVMLEGLSGKSSQVLPNVLMTVASDAPEYAPHLQAALSRERQLNKANPRRWHEAELVLAYLVWKNTKSPDALAVLIEGLQLAEDWEVAIAVRLLGEVGPEAAPAAPLLVPLLQSPSSDMPQIVIQALEKMGPDVRTTAPALRKMLTNRECAIDAAWALLKIAPDDPAIAGLNAQSLRELDVLDWKRTSKLLSALQVRATALPELRKLLKTSTDEEAVDTAFLIWKIEPTPAARVALLRRIHTNFRFGLFAGKRPELVLPGFRVAAFDLLEPGGAQQTLLQMPLDDSLAAELLWKQMSENDQAIREAAFNVAVRRLLRYPPVTPP